MKTLGDFDRYYLPEITEKEFERFRCKDKDKDKENEIYLITDRAVSDTLKLKVKVLS